jgi:cob(I)alamin adenosyltransferase
VSAKKIYTKTGDNGETSLRGGGVYPKSDAVFEVLGTLDELNACLGLVKAPRMKQINHIVKEVQNDLFSFGAFIADPQSSEKELFELENRVVWLEERIDLTDKEIPPLDNFIIPGGSNTSAQLHLARAVCRRLERRLVELGRKDRSGKKIHGMEVLVKYFNRLSDMLFVLARYVNFKSGVKDIIWKKTL